MVIGIIALLLGILLPTLGVVREKSRTIACAANLRQIGVALHAYANDNGGSLPYGPKAPPFTSAGIFYPSTGAPTSLVTLNTGEPVGIGLLLDEYLQQVRQVLFCPSPFEDFDADAELAKVGRTQTQCSYYFRHGSNTALFDSPGVTPTSQHLVLSNLGMNRLSHAIHALAMDTQCSVHPSLLDFGIVPRHHHGKKTVNVLFDDGSVANESNRQGLFEVDLTDADAIHQAFDRILRVFENGDASY